MTLKSIIISLLCLSAIFLSGASVFMSRTTLPTNLIATDDEADTTIENVVATVFNKAGYPTLTVITPKMLHYSKNDLTQITSPKIILSQEPNNIWRINSVYATAFEGIDKIIFHEHVLVSHQESPDHPLTTLLTSSLTIYPNKQIAETNEAISIKEAASRVNAVGMHANLNDGTIKLLSQAREEYAPT